MQRGGQARYAWRNITFLSILILVISTGVLSLYFLRQNNTEMQRRRSAVFRADEQGVSNEELERKLQSLRDHVVNHMNTDLYPPGTNSREPPIQLPYKYYRDTVWYWEQRIKPIDDRLPENLRAELDAARRVCEEGSYGISERLNCLVEETKDVNAMPEPPILRTEYYSYHFVSPRWSPDKAGWSIVACGFSVVILFFRLFKF